MQTVENGKTNLVNVTIDFYAKDFMVNDARGILDFMGKQNIRIATVYAYKGNVLPINVEHFKTTMGKLQEVFPSTLFLTRAGMNEEETEIDKDHIEFLEAAGFADFNMYVRYEGSVAFIYKSKEAIPVYERLEQIYSEDDCSDRGKADLPTVKAILTELNTLV